MRTCSITIVLHTLVRRHKRMALNFKVELAGIGEQSVKRFTANQLELRTFPALIARDFLPLLLLVFLRFPLRHRHCQHSSCWLCSWPKNWAGNKISSRWTKALPHSSDARPLGWTEFSWIYHGALCKAFRVFAGHVCIAYFLFVQLKLMCKPFNYTTNKQTAQKVLLTLWATSRWNGMEWRRVSYGQNHFEFEGCESRNWNLFGNSRDDRDVL